MIIEWNSKRYTTNFDPLLLSGLSAFNDGDDHIISGFYDISKLKTDHTYDLREIDNMVALYGKVTLDDIYVKGLIGKIDSDSSAINYEDANLSLSDDERLRVFCVALRTLLFFPQMGEAGDEANIAGKIKTFDYPPFKYLSHTASLNNDHCK